LGECGHGEEEKDQPTFAVSHGASTAIFVHRSLIGEDELDDTGRMPINAKRYSGVDPYLFVLLAMLVLVLSVDVFGLLGVGDPKGSAEVDEPPATITAWKALDADARELLNREYDSVVSEIKMRIEQEHLLFSLKFGLVGAILWAFLQIPSKSDSQFEITPFAALAGWAAVVAASIVDLRVMSNQSFIIALGGWCRQYEQLALGANGAQFGWEAFLADHLLSEPYYPALRVSGQILTALLFCVTSLIFLRAEGSADPATARISSAGAIVSISIMTMAAVSMRPSHEAILFYLAAGTAAAGIAAFLARPSRSRSLDLDGRPSPASVE
jgi:hypothetical protein